MLVRAKFRVQSVTTHDWNRETKTVKLAAVYGGSEENQSFAKATPNGVIEMQIDNPPAAEVFELGREFYVDFTAVDLTAADKKSA